MVRTKVFVGNLAFTTKEPELAAAFQAAGKVIGANIITRGPRSLGYGFVEMDSETDAQKAVELLNKKDLNGRQINVEVARPREELKEKAETETDSRPPRRRRRAPRQRGAGKEKKESPAAEGEGATGESAEKKKKKRVPRRRISEAPREESKTTLFVANLPFSLDDEAFEKTVAELGVKPKAAHVVKKRNGRSKGYGFVEFDNEADQKKALDGLNKKTVDGRELSVKIALTELPKDETKPAQPAEKKVAPAEKPAEKKAEKPAEKPAEKKAAAPAEKKAAAPAEKKAAAPAEKKAEKPAEKKAAAPAEKKAEKPAEKKSDAPAKSSEKK